MKTKIRFNRFIIMLIPGLIGFSLFYLVPFFFSFSYMLKDEGLFLNLNAMLNNGPFMRALKNTLLFLFISVPPNMLLSLIFALLLNKAGGMLRRLSLLMMLLPMAVPSAAGVYFWKCFFAANGFINGFLSRANLGAVDWIGSKYAQYAVLVIYLWKNLGFNIILYFSALRSIPKEYAQYAKTEGATELQIFTTISLSLLKPTFFAAGLMSVVNSFKIFREIYLITGAYPSGNIYMVQHYLNNMFSALNYSKLSMASNIFIAIIIVFACAAAWANKLLARR